MDVAPCPDKSSRHSWWHERLQASNHKNNLTRQVTEGWRQVKFEQLEQEGKVSVQNSKLDFNRPFMTSIAVQKGNINDEPGQPGQRSTGQKRTTKTTPRPAKKVRFSNQSPSPPLSPSSSSSASVMQHPPSPPPHQSSSSRACDMKHQTSITPQSSSPNLSNKSRNSKPTNIDNQSDISAELEISRNISATIHQEYSSEKHLLAQMAEFPHNQSVFNKFALVRRSSTPVESNYSLKRKFDRVT